MMDSILCWLGFHVWSKWSEPKEWTASTVQQTRNCLHCNILDQRIM